MVTVRLAEASDVSDLFTLYQEEGWETFSESKIADLLKSSIYLVVIEDEHLVAFARYLTDGCVTTFVAELLVSTPYRGNGFASLLLDEIRGLLPETRVELISVANGFYKHLGFRHVGQGFRLGGKKNDAFGSEV